ncbi:FAD-dependent oxidoreductase [Rhodocytophaga rosea]|uniref:FAD-dependent oxidoreductase n=1 Tax=Rhodocytophaga rosea TaxID=2704465 RepID=A0A6C0GIV1_9BACT|nr:FAD-dependent oxidoreductase [Rhodocytophaga rosea]QHT67948.1 FAD-dependent oxidoreductase [Rhodocytophaga rosea]
MDLKSEHPFWLVRDGLIASYPSLRKDIQCDIAIVGGGITGALMAYSLVQTGANVIVIDKRDVGTGSTSASTSILQYEIDVPLHKLITYIGEQEAVRSYKLCVEAIGKIEKVVQETDAECGFERKKSLYYASNNKYIDFIEKEFEARTKYGIAVTYLEASQIRERFNFESPAAILSEEAAQLDAYALAHHLYNYSQQFGLRIFDSTQINEIQFHKQSLTLQTDTNQTIQAKKAVFCTGYETQNFLPEMVVKLKSTYAMVSEPLEAIPDFLKEAILWETQTPYLYLRTTDDNRILIGGEDDNFVNPQKRDARIEKKQKALLKKFNHLFPELTIYPDFTWAGTFGETKDGLPYIGEHPDFPGCYFALGFGGNGIIFSMIAADIIKDLYAGRPNADVQLFRFDR